MVVQWRARLASCTMRRKWYRTLTLSSYTALLNTSTSSGLIVGALDPSAPPSAPPGAPATEDAKEEEEEEERERCRVGSEESKLGARRRSIACKGSAGGRPKSPAATAAAAADAAAVAAAVAAPGPTNRGDVGRDGGEGHVEGSPDVPKT